MISQIIVVKNRVLRFARNDNINKIIPLVSLRGVLPLRDDAAISILNLSDITKLKSNLDKPDLRRDDVVSKKIRKERRVL